MKNNSYYYLFTLIIAAVSLFIDIISKLFIIKFIKNPIDIIPGFFSLVHSVNQGAIFGTFQGMLPLFLFITLVFLIIVFYAKDKLIGNKLLCISYGLIVGGALGNIIDRLVLPPYGGVTDFLDFHLKTASSLLSYPVFNIADICIVVGVIIFIFTFKTKEKI